MDLVLDAALELESNHSFLPGFDLGDAMAAAIDIFCTHLPKARVRMIVPGLDSASSFMTHCFWIIATAKDGRAPILTVRARVCVRVCLHAGM